MNRVIMKKRKQRESIFQKPINGGDKRERKTERKKKKRKDNFAQSKISIEAIVIVEKRSSNRQQSSFFHIDTVSIGFREKMSDNQIT